MRRILIVEDDQVMAVALSEGLAFEGYRAEIAGDGQAGLRLALEQKFDLILLDVMLPKLGGFDLCQQLRGAGHHTPVIMLTARSLEVEKVLGLKIGADDYVTKPFSLMELLARIEAVLRRTARRMELIEAYGFDDVELDFKQNQATKGGLPLELTAREFKLLKFLIENRGEAVSREQLLNRVWAYDGAPLTRTVDTHIAKLRQKIESDPNHPRRLITVHRVGYKFIG